MLFFFFFSSRRRHTRYWRDWSSDVCSSDLFGLAKNNRLIAEIVAELAEAAEENRQSGKPARRFKDFQYSTRKSWSRQRRVVGKAEWMIPSVAESQSATKPRRKKKSIRVGDIDLAMLEGRA